MNTFKNISLVATLIILLALALAFLALYLLPVNEPNRVQDIFGNLFAEFLGILVTVGIIGVLLELSADRERRRRAEPGLSRIATAITRHVNFLEVVYKASTDEAPDSFKDARVVDVLNERFLETIAHLDASAPAPITYANLGFEVDWVVYTEQELRRLNIDVRRSVERYGQYMDAALVSACESVLMSPLSENISVFTPYRTSEFFDFKPETGFPLFAFMPEHVLQEHLRLFKALVAQYEKQSRKTVRLSDHLWLDHIAPKLGSARLDVQIVKEPRGTSISTTVLYKK